MVYNSWRDVSLGLVFCFRCCFTARGMKNEGRNSKERAAVYGGGAGGWPNNVNRNLLKKGPTYK